MPRLAHDRVVRKLLAAEGYLELSLPERALQILQSQTDWTPMQFEASYLTGEALRSLERYREALKPLEVAAALRPGDVGVAIALGWCYKRTNRLAQAIDALHRAERENPHEPLLHYNLACYWSLAGNRSKALDELTLALDLEPKLRSLIPNESDFNSLRGQPEFERLAVDPAPLT